MVLNIPVKQKQRHSKLILTCDLNCSLGQCAICAKLFKKKTKKRALKLFYCYLLKLKEGKLWKK